MVQPNSGPAHLQQRAHGITLTTSWDTDRFQRGNTISACALKVTSELDTLDNFYVGAGVQVMISGDVNGDGTVNALDLAELSHAYGSALASCDLNGDSKVDILDLLGMGRNYGKD
jgi:hypothetical protein